MKRMLLHITWVHFIVSLVVFALFIGIVLPAQALAQASVTSGSGSPDLSLFYTPRQFYTWAFEYGEAGRAHYIQTRFGFDLIWPLAYGAFFYTGILVGGLRTKQLLSWLPVFTVGFDYLENIFASLAMGLYPIEVSVIVYVAATATFFKWTALSLSSLLLVGGLLTRSVQLLKGRTNIVS